MRRIALLAAAVAMLLFALAPAAQAEVVINEDLPLDQVVGFSCPDPDPDVGYVPSEDIRVTGTVHLLVASTVDKAGNTHDVYSYSFKHVTGVGLTSGDSYVWRTVNNAANNVRPSDPEETTNDGAFTYVLRGRMIHLGEGGSELGDDQIFRYTVHITQAENGEVTTQFEKIAESCN
jgi:hypothetical protein